ncbi:helix-turn-helix transcriptional regulator [Paenibacillus sinopodophylli]|uniref:helix-turn-helix transcriptional regulator n=1 Tax=Paenibacillus sinopodophylli TaxID=1837342 RepID=UPI00110CBB15|nr:helix-turn-helix transcriptional regulator [Paenibacillus sinopodophylli]
MSTLRDIRKKKGISMTYLAQKLGYSHASGYCNIESGRTKIKLNQATIIARELGVSVEEISKAV